MYSSDGAICVMVDKTLEEKTVPSDLVREGTRSLLESTRETTSTSQTF